MKVLGIFTHPDDEVIFGWPIFQDKLINRHLAICIDDYKKAGTAKSDALKEVCQVEGIKLDWIGHSEGSYFRMMRVPDVTTPVHRIQNLIKKILRIVDFVKPDYVFTHNFWGDNGNSEHRLTSEIVVNFVMGYNILMTDRCDSNNAWLAYDTIPRMHREFFLPKNVLKNCSLSEEFFLRCKAVYDKYGMWTGPTVLTDCLKKTTLYCMRK